MGPDLWQIVYDVQQGLKGPFALEQALRILGNRWAEMGATTAPFWRLVSVQSGAGIAKGPSYIQWGRSIPATVQGLGALGIAGVAIAVAAGVYVALGAGYYQGRQRARERGFMSGFSRGVVTGVLNWAWPIVWDRFRVRVSYINRADPMAGKHEALAENEGLFLGYSISSPLSEEKKKNYRKALRALAGRTDDGAWSQDRDIARNQQVDYVVALAGAGVQKGLIVPE